MISILLGWILKYRNWAIERGVTRALQTRSSSMKLQQAIPYRVEVGSIPPLFCSGNSGNSGSMGSDGSSDDSDGSSLHSKAHSSSDCIQDHNSVHSEDGRYSLQPNVGTQYHHDVQNVCYSQFSLYRRIPE